MGPKDFVLKAQSSEKKSDSIIFLKKGDVVSTLNSDIMAILTCITPFSDRVYKMFLELSIAI